MRAAPTCPFCDARDVERVAQWGGQMITAQWRCRGCGSYFEALREEFDDLRRVSAGAARRSIEHGCPAEEDSRRN